jgi:hypothetical protein
MLHGEEYVRFKTVVERARKGSKTNPGGANHEKSLYYKEHTR